MVEGGANLEKKGYAKIEKDFTKLSLLLKTLNYNYKYF